MNTKVGLMVLVLMLLVDLPLTLSRQCGDAMCKVHESSSRPVDFKLCGSMILMYYNSICAANSIVAKRRRRRGLSADQLVQSKNEAQDFLSFRRRKRGSRTDIVEECCGEMCRTEEIREYCM